jgi:hypothetical protein
LPAHDFIDNAFWATIGPGILVLAVICAYRAKRIRTGILAGAWSGFVSGTLACCVGLSIIVFGMRFLLQDPLNVAEWAACGMDSRAPTMAAYLAYETFAGAFLHPIVLGLGMGALLGALGGVVGKAIKTVSRRYNKTRL